MGPFANKGGMKEVEVIACPECGNTWMTEIEVNQYLPINKPAMARSQPIRVSKTLALQCLKCQRVVFPPSDAFYSSTNREAARELAAMELLPEEENKPRQESDTKIVPTVDVSPGVPTRG